MAAGVLAIAYFAWFRDSSLVAVHDVKVEGATSADRGRIVSALTDAAQGMTTLHVRTDRLTAAVSGFPTVAAVSADPSFPHGLTVRVTERESALIASDGHHQVAVAPDGWLLAGVHTSGNLPQLKVDSLPASGRLGGEPLAEALTVGAAPAPLQPLIASVSVSRDYGVVVAMRGGFALRFGTGDRAAAKWAAAAAVLADPKVTSLGYVDVRVPERPAVGG
jgi:cell division septal protein FtsQ